MDESYNFEQVEGCGKLAPATSKRKASTKLAKALIGATQLLAVALIGGTKNPARFLDREGRARPSDLAPSAFPLQGVRQSSSGLWVSRRL